MLYECYLSVAYYVFISLYLLSLGAIALGHPLGCTGARQIATLLPELKRTGARYGVTSMCIGTGMGAASVIERE